MGGGGGGKLPLPFFDVESVGLRGRWEEMGGNFLLRPPDDQAPKALVHFLGGAFVGAAPHLTYNYLLSGLAEMGFLVVATPYPLGFDYLNVSERAKEAEWEREQAAPPRSQCGGRVSASCIRFLLDFEYPLPPVTLTHTRTRTLLYDWLPLPLSPLLRLSVSHAQVCDGILDRFEQAAVPLAAQYGALPVVGIGHSCGALLQLLITCLFPDTPRAANALISFNNKPVSDAVPGFEELVLPLVMQVCIVSCVILSLICVAVCLLSSSRFFWQKMQPRRC